MNEVLVKIPITAEPLEVLKQYGEDAYRELKAKRLRCILHPNEEKFIYIVNPKNEIK